MHVPTHILSGWCLGNLLPLTPRERVGCMVAATAADLDGLGILFGERAYWDFHHKLGHNVFFAVLLAGVLAALLSDGTRRRRVCTFLAFLTLAHLHLVLDYFGSGPGWPIWYLWPAASVKVENPHAWPFFSWQNIACAYSLVAWAVWIAWRDGRTPLELLMPRLDGRLVGMVRRKPATVAAGAEARDGVD